MKLRDGVVDAASQTKIVRIDDESGRHKYLQKAALLSTQKNVRDGD